MNARMRNERVIAIADSRLGRSVDQSISQSVLSLTFGRAQ